MRTFNVLEASEDIHRNTILEASAGTGKTFSIENIIVRLILESDTAIDRILVVTFTRPATRDLRVRIRQNIQNAIEMFKGQRPEAGYVETHRDNAESMVRRLQRALLLFDDAAIETIHGFCSRSLREQALEGKMPLRTTSEGEQPTKMVYLRIIRDFFRTGLHEESISPAQLEVVSRRGVKHVEMSLLRLIQKPLQTASTTPYEHLLGTFQGAFKSVSFDGDVLLDYHAQYNDRYKKVEDFDAWIERFALCTGSHEDFEFLIRDGLLIIDKYNSENAKKRGEKPPELPLVALLEQVIKPIIDEASSTEAILARMAHSIEKMVSRFLQQEEMWRFDDLLTAMHHAIESPSFAAAIRSRYDAVIVDEFQDTDPIQWEIFSSLFVSDDWNGALYIVGDPKQSIYAFRDADIYTYLDAVKLIGEEACASLNVNYRSHPLLIEELNRFFDVPGIFPLPTGSTSLPYHHVEASNKLKSEPLDDGKGMVHLCIASDWEKRFSLDRVRKEAYYPYVAGEITKLAAADVPLDDIAILVRTNAQGQELARVLRQHAIPTQLLQSGGLAGSPAVQGLKVALAAALDPHNLSKARVALAGPLYGWSDERLAILDPLEAMPLFHKLHGLTVAAFFDELFEQTAPHLLSSEEGFLIYEELSHLMEMALKEEARAPLSLDGLDSLLDQLELMEFEEDQAVKRMSSAEGEAVQIMTLHASKGLEFDVVFALGLIDPSPEPERFVPNRATRLQEAIIDKSDPRYEAYCAEIDAEKMRLLYVALTRAKRRVYVPYIDDERAPTRKPGRHSPMELYAALNPAFTEQFTQERITRSDSIVGERLQTKTEPELSPPPRVVIPWSERFVTSFSSLAGGGHALVLEGDPPREMDPPVKSLHTLPAGADTGTFLHELLERMPLHVDRLEAFLEKELYHSAFKPWKQVLLQMLEKVLLLPELEGVKDTEMYREINFLYPTNDGLLNGVIDLIFRRNGRYYILDWKSNWLGVDASFYSQQHLEAAMAAHEYELQASIYTEALRRYLGIIEPEAFESCFGGVYYVFLRGIGEGAGILHLREQIAPRS